MTAKKRAKSNSGEPANKRRRKRKKKTSKTKRSKPDFEEIDRSSPTLVGIISAVVLGLLLVGFVTSYLEGTLYFLTLITGFLCIYWFCWRGSRTIYNRGIDGKNYSFDYLAYICITPRPDVKTSLDAIPKKKRRVLTNEEREALLVKPSARYVTSEDYLNSLFAVIAGCLVVFILVIYVSAIEPNLHLRESSPSQVVGKNCSSCGKGVPMSSQAGDTCPHCNVKWSYEK